MLRKTLLIISIGIVLISCNFQKKEDKPAINKKNTAVQRNLDTIKENSKTNIKDVKDAFNEVLDTLPPKQKDRFIDDYKNNLNTLVKKNLEDIKKASFQVVEEVVPRTQSEFSYYYNLTYSGDEKTEKFDIINQLLLKYSEQDKGDLLFLLLNISEFVDGEYAEGYFSDIEYIVSKNEVKFCAIYKYLSIKSKKNLEGLYLEVCKGIERPEEDY